MKNRKGFVSIELLLVIGFIVTGLAVVFNTNKKVDEGLEQMKFKQELNNIIKAAESQNQKFGGYPAQETAETLDNTKIYNDGEFLIRYETTQRWDYQSISLTEPDNIGYSSGLILIKIHGDAVREISENFVLSTFSELCLNGKSSVKIKLGLTIAETLNKYDWCLLKQNVKLFNAE